MATKDERGALANRLDELGASGAAGMARGANRILDTQLSDMGVKNVTPQGKSGGSKSGAMTKKAVQTGGAGDGVSRRRSATGATGSGTSSNRATVVPRGKTPMGEGPLGFAFNAMKQGKESGRTSARQATRRTGPGYVTDAQTDITSKETIANAQKGMKGIHVPKFVRDKNVQDAQPTTPVKTGGTKRKGHVTIHHSRPGGAGKPVSPFSEKGINQIFGSAAELAKLFSSKEFQSRKAKGIQNSAAVKGRQADVKAKTEQLKAYGSVRSQLAESDPENPLIAKIDEIIQADLMGDGGGPNPEMLGKLADKFDNEQIKTILGIIQ
jgi:hypothetical protein